MLKTPQGLPALPGPCRIHEPGDVSAGPIRQILDGAADRGGVPDRQRGPENPRDFGPARIARERSDHRDRVVGDRPVEREVRVEPPKVLRELRRRVVRVHSDATTGVVELPLRPLALWE